MSKRAEEAANKDFEGRFDTDDQTVIWFMDKMKHSYIKGYEQAEKDLGWHPSTEHPPVDEEVIVLTDIITKGGLNIGFGRIAFGHIVDKDIAVDYDGWNIDGVRYWMPMPEIPEEEKK